MYIVTKMFISVKVVKLLVCMSQEMLMSIYDEIVKVRQLLEMTLKDKIEKELEKILTTKERKIVWALSDGLMDTKNIAKKAGVSQRAVQQTIKDLQIADFIVVERRGYPKRKFNYVPYDWTLKTRNGGLQPEQGPKDTERNIQQT